MRNFAILFVRLIVTLARLARPGGLRSVVAESVLLRHQLVVLSRGRKSAPNLRATDRILVGLCTLFMRPTRILRGAVRNVSASDSRERSAKISQLGS